MSDETSGYGIDCGKGMRHEREDERVRHRQRHGFCVFGVGEDDGGDCGNDGGTCSVNYNCEGKGFDGGDQDADEERFGVGFCETGCGSASLSNETNGCSVDFGADF